MSDVLKEKQVNDYIFTEHNDDRELHRLRLIETAFDASSKALLQRCGVAPDWSCLELGPGAGSIMRWLGETVGRNGLVCGVDRTAKYIRDLTGPPFVVSEQDVMDLTNPGSFDLIHGRYVLVHNHQPRDMIRRVASWLKPGGHVVFEEPDFTSARPVTDTGSEAQHHVNRAMCAMFSGMGLNPGYGLELPADLVHAGLNVVGVHAEAHLCNGTSPVAQVMDASCSALREKYTATGFATDHDLSTYQDHARDPTHWAVYYTTVAVVAKHELVGNVSP